MTLKAGFAQVAAPTSPGSVNLTNASAGFSSDVKAAIIFASYATANDTQTAISQVCIGLVGSQGGTTEKSIGCGGDNGVASSSESRANDTTHGFIAKSYTGTTVDVANVSAFLTNGITLNFTTTSGRARLINALLLGGDIQAKVVQVSWTGASGAQSAAHGLAGTPGIVIGLGCATAADATGTGSREVIGFWDGTTAVGYNSRKDALANPQQCIGIIDDTAWSVASVADTVTISADATNVTATVSAGVTQTLALLCIYGANLKAAAGVFNAATSTGDAVSVSGLPFAPQAMLIVGTRQITIGSSTSDTANVFSLGAAALHSGSVTQGCIADSADDAATPTVRQCWTSAAKNIRTPNDIGAESVVATLKTFNTDGITHNYTGVNLASKMMYLLLQETTGASASSNPLGGKLVGPFGGKLA